MSATDAATAVRPFTISRTFDAPLDLVWKANTEADRLRQWWGPKDAVIAHCTADVRPGGVFHYGIGLPGGQIMWGKLTYREVAEPQTLTYVVSFSDENRGVTRHPLSPTWPLEILSITTFAARNGKTTMTTSWVPINATPEEIRTFDEGRESMQQGFTGMMDQFGAYLAKAQA